MMMCVGTSLDDVIFLPFLLNLTAVIDGKKWLSALMAASRVKHHKVACVPF
jgi:hypothetical protein